MSTRKIVQAGTIAGLIMGITLFIGGAITSRIIYGPQFAPPGKFEPSQMNAFYFIWTKLLIGLFFGLIFTFAYEKLPLARRINGFAQGLKYGFFFWLIISLWNLSHPLIYGSFNPTNQLFWLIYSLIGFLGFGGSLGVLYKKLNAQLS